MAVTEMGTVWALPERAPGAPKRTTVVMASMLGLLRMLGSPFGLDRNFSTRTTIGTHDRTIANQKRQL